VDNVIDVTQSSAIKNRVMKNPREGYYDAVAVMVPHDNYRTESGVAQILASISERTTVGTIFDFKRAYTPSQFSPYRYLTL